MVGNNNGSGFAPAIEFDGVRVFHGDCREVLKSLPDNSVDSIVTDPPYGLSNTTPELVSKTIVRWVSGERDFIPTGAGFMGKEWDSFVPPPAVWDECLRVLKPGGHLLAFFGSRTMDLGQLAIRLAGFEIRDNVAWLYGSGFPKSLDVSKAIDKTNAESGRVLRFVRWMKNTGLKARQIDNVLKERGLISPTSNRAVHYFNEGQPNIPTAEFWSVIRPMCSDVPGWVDELVARVEAEREVIGQKTWSNSANHFVPGENHKARVNLDETAPATPEAEQWQGWGTALKPAFEPIVVGRKPLVGTVAENVLEWGVGGLNIDDSRIASTGEHKKPFQPTNKDREVFGAQKGFQPSNAEGRWPANVILDEHTAELLDQQSGVLKSGAKKPSVSNHDPSQSVASMIQGNKPGETLRTYTAPASEGGASRFFYVAKASKRDRNEGLEESNKHPTVKPTALMRYLIKLVTPPGGTVLDPFTGSGSTGKAAILDGFGFVGVELTEDYLPIIEGRLRWAMENRDEGTLF